jgi:polysaccharide pyruvyl transferase CsaB
MTTMEKGQKFLLYGMYGAINVGDELVCYAMATGLQRVLNQPRIFAASHNKGVSRRFVPFEELEFLEGGTFHYKFWLRFLDVLAYVRSMDAIVIGGGGLFQDQYSWRLPAGSAFMAALGALWDKPTFIVGVGVGPIKRRWLKRAILRLFPHVTSISVRDEESYRALEELNVPLDNVCVTADVVPSIDLGSRLGGDVSQDENLIALVLRDWPGLDYESVAKLLDESASKGYRTHLHCFEPSSDSRFYDRVLSFCSPPTLRTIEKVSPTNLQESVQGIKKAGFVISMRLHGCILAADLDIPLLPVVYERKVRAFAEQMNLVDWLKEVKDLGPELLESIESMRSYWKQHRLEMQSRYQKIRSNSQRNFEILRQKLDTCRGAPLNRQEKLRVTMGLCTLLLFAAGGELGHLSIWPFKQLLKEFKNRSDRHNGEKAVYGDK